MAQGNDSLSEYNAKRDFSSTPEPKGARKKGKGALFVIQKHDATRLHYDFRLELDGVLKSWAVTKGPSLDPSDKRLAVRTEDHPVDYGGFEGVIPKGYGAGTVMLWDRGEWEPKEDPHEGLKKGALKFSLKGERLKGGFALIRMKKRKGEKRENWLLVKERDEKALEDGDPTEKWTKSVKSKRAMEAIAEEGENYKKGKSYSRRTKEKKSPRRNSSAGKSAGKKSASLKFTPPQLATLRDDPPEGDEWLHELKYDGYRIQALIENGKVRLITRNEKDWTRRYPAIADALAKLDVDDVAIDGELVAVDKEGRSRFGLLQNAADDKSTELRYYAFDLLYLNGKKICGDSLRARKKLLRPIIEDAGPPLFYSDHIEGNGDEVIRKACAMHLEGVISKKAEARYRSGRGTTWIKSKCVGNDEFVIAGYRKSDKRGRPFSSLLLGEYAGDELVYRGRVGTGFDEAAFGKLCEKMRPLERKTSPFDETPSEAKREAVWLTPKLVAQIAYTEKTSDGRLRHPSFLGLRTDKPAEEVTVMARDDKGETSEFKGVRLTHPDRVMYPGQGATKRQVAEYYAANAERILKYLKNRPLSLVRCPAGRQDECFFQKHHGASVPEALKSVEIKEKDGKNAHYLMIDNVKGLIAAAQIGALELHIWGARADRIERPERVVFDLDPDEGVSFDGVKDAALELRDVLKAAGLQSFPLLTGGKGVHVIAPIERRRDWPDVKTFAKGLAQKLADASPKRYIATASKSARKGKIFIDWLRNERGATAIAPYSLRARPGAPVATPVSWRELSKVDAANAYTLDNISARLAHLKSDPWKGYDNVRQSVTDSVLDFVK
ncbi:DNA ligase D [Hyphococcus sp.]|uniref:DNA ligase D n=1 Tax=Hyphococcus sp. TaxID=2038636 RepID=UPI0035C66705